MNTCYGLLALLLPIYTVAYAQSYPTRHVELVSPAGAGGGSGLVAQQVEVTQFLTAMGLVLKK